MNLLFRLFSIEKPFNHFDSNIKKHGWNRACSLLVKSLGLKMKVNLKNFPYTGPVLVYANHPTGLDPFIIGSVLGRDDYKFLGDSYHLRKGQYVAGHLAPTITAAFWKELVMRSPTNWPGYVYMRLVTPPVIKIKSKQLNKKALALLVSHIKQRGLAVVFPSGGAYEFLPWKKGLEAIIRELNRRKIKFTLYRIRINRLSEFKLILHFILGKKMFSDLKIEGYPVKNYDLRSDKLMNILKLK